MADTITNRVSIIIPGRCEPYFQKTVESVLERATGDIEIIAVVDGPGQNPPVISTDNRIKVIRLPQSIGQRAGYNLGVRESSGEYVMKIDAHALMSYGFDEVLKSNCPDKTVVLPEMRKLDVHKWEYKPGGKTHFMLIGMDLYCHYWKDYRKRDASKVEYPEVMTGQGSCWFTRRTWNDHIGLLDEGVGSWGNVGIEISLRTWLCGGQQIVNKNAWQAHWFRKDEGGFTYPMDGRQVAKAHNYTRKHYYFNDNAFQNQTRPFRWIIDRFAPVPGWEAYLSDEFKSNRVIVYYTDNAIDSELANCVRSRLKKVCGPIPIISVSQEPINFGKNVCVGKKERRYESIYEQILAGLETVPEESIVYLCEHDVFYHPSHFAFLPPKRDRAYFNQNRFYWRLGMNSFFKARGKRGLSQGVAYREYWMQHVKDRLDRWKTDPGNLMRIRNEGFESERPNVDIRHDDNFTPHGKWKMEYFTGKKKGIFNLPGWGSPGHFMSKTGYRGADKHDSITDPYQYLHDRFNKDSRQVAPIRCQRFKRTDLAALFSAFGFKKGAEVGVKEGKFSQVLCKRNKDLELLCVDPWCEYAELGLAKVDGNKAEMLYQRALSRLRPYKATLIRKTSMDAVNSVPDGSLDFVYIDADHTFDFVMRDIIEWAKKVRVGGIVSGHDYFRFRNAGVVPAVDTYTHAHQIHEYFITDEKEASFFWVKE